MGLEKGMIVKSLSGHDKDRFYLVVKVEGRYAWIADGKRRKVEKPKKKNSIHLQRTLEICEMNMVTNRSVRTLLKNCKQRTEGA